jgi:hypothetical protein
MTTIAATFSRHLGKREAVYQTFSRPSRIKHIRCFLEQINWDKKILSYEDQANKICVGIMIASLIYFIPVVINVFLR